MGRGAEKAVDDSEGDFSRIGYQNKFFHRSYTATIIGTFPDKSDTARILEIVASSPAFLISVIVNAENLRSIADKQALISPR
ncbi:MULTISPECIES: hypothetical protein [unclassified Microcoleus]|uniref:hypothetical protein n=1 Tax=unclassified Microcoleus TaxID=2642155 RepID=UPI002FD4CB4E